MFVYSKYPNAKKVALLYPDKDSFSKKGIYYDELGNASDKEYAIIGLAVNKHIKQWQKDISNQINIIKSGYQIYNLYPFSILKKTLK